MAVILVGGLAGVLLPLLGKWLASPDSVTGRAVRAFSGGAILGVALVGALQQQWTPTSLFSVQPLSCDGVRSSQYVCEHCWC